MDKKRRRLTLLIIIVPLVFILFLIGVLAGSPIVSLVLIVLLVTALGILYNRKPELFEKLFPKKQASTPSVRSVPSEPPRHDDIRKTYLELASVNASGGKNIIMDCSPFTVGRKPSCDCVMDNPEVSGMHLRLEFREEDRMCFVTDLNSTNFTFLNSEKLEPNKPRSLHQGDILQIANEAFQVEYAQF